MSSDTDSQAFFPTKPSSNPGTKTLLPRTKGYFSILVFSSLFPSKSKPVVSIISLSHILAE
jgi:hypothetical protein